MTSAIASASEDDQGAVRKYDSSLLRQAFVAAVAPNVDNIQLWATAGISQRVRLRNQRLQLASGQGMTAAGGPPKNRYNQDGRVNPTIGIVPSIPGESQGVDVRPMTVP